MYLFFLIVGREKKVSFYIIIICLRQLMYVLFMGTMNFSGGELCNQTNLFLLSLRLYSLF